jgi:uncharacterized protein YhjY with autotransporter beta-barrel domain
MACAPWKLQMTVAQLNFDVTVSEINKFAERLHSVTSFCFEDEKAEQSWDSMMKRVNDHHHELFLKNLQPL